MTIQFKAQCVLISELNGSQYFAAMEPVPEHLRTTILTGLDRARDVRVGDSGVLTYRTAPSRGYYQFTKDPAP
jgi:hypothetical protein